MIKYDVAIVGGGASGLTCALALKRLKRQAKVCVIDACDRLGKKLAATGNGQGNVSNINLTAGNYHGGGSELAYSIIGGDYNLPASLFNCILTCDDEGRIYPSGRQASALSDSLIRELNSLGAVLITSTRVTQVKKGFEWDSEKSLLDCIKSEYREFARAVSEGDREHMEDEMGDILFATVNLARWHKIDAEQALLHANKKFMTRFRKMEELAVKPLEEYSYEEFDQLWKQVKKELV